MKHELRVKREFPTQAKSMRQVSLVLSEFFDKSNKSAIKPPDDVDGFFIFRLAHCPPGHDDSSSFLVKARDDLGDISLFSVRVLHSGHSETHPAWRMLITGLELTIRKLSSCFLFHLQWRGKTQSRSDCRCSQRARCWFCPFQFSVSLTKVDFFFNDTPGPIAPLIFMSFEVSNIIVALKPICKAPCRL